MKDARASARADKRRDHRIAVVETIGCALAALRRLAYVCYDEDIRTTITDVRSKLSVAQSKVRARIDESIVEGKQNEDLHHRSRD